MIFRIDIMCLKALLFLSIVHHKGKKYINTKLILDDGDFITIDKDQQKLLIAEKLGLIKQTNHTFDKVIDIKQNEFQNQDQIWILYKKDNHTILSKYQIVGLDSQNYYLQLNYECYQFYFIRKSQIIIDCQNSINNILILFDIELNLQQSFFHSQYKQSKLRNLLKVQPSLFVFIQQKQILKLCYNFNKYQVCDQLACIHKAHTVYLNGNELILISEYWIDILLIEYVSQFTFIKNFRKIHKGTEYQIQFYFYHSITDNHFLVDSYLMQNIRDGFKYIMQINDNLIIGIIQFDCIYDLTTFNCYYKYCICLNDTHIIMQLIGYREESLLLHKQQNDKFIHLDKDNRVLYLINDNKLIIKYYNQNSNEINSNLIPICSQFINLVVFKLKLIIVCTDQMILYNKISNYRYIYSGNIELYDQQFLQSSLVINSDYHLFYIIENETLHVFNIKLPLSQIYVTQIKIDKFDTYKSYKNHICFQNRNNLKCYYYQINIKFIYEDEVEYHQVFKVSVCGKNKYDRICKDYITRLDQQNRKIFIKRHKQSFIVNKNTKEIVLDSRFFSGSVDKILINKYQVRPKVQLYSHKQINLSLDRKTYYGGYDNLIFIMNNQQLSVYDIETNVIKNSITLKPFRYVLKYKTNQILIGYSYLSVFNCDSDCKELITFDFKLSLSGILQIHNNTLYTSYKTQLITYNLKNLIKNESFQPIQEELDANMIDISQDSKGNMCMVYIDIEYKLVLKHLEKIRKYNILNSLRDQGVELNYFNQDIIYSMKILNDCKMLYINAIFGTYFLELASEFKFLAQLVVQQSYNLHLNQLLLGENYLFYVQQFPQYISIQKFAYNQIYNSQFIDLSSKIQKQNRKFSFKDYYFQVYNDQLYLAQTGYQLKLFIFRINSKIIISLEQNITDKEEIQITLVNSDENKSFILELVLEENNFHLLFQWIMIVLLLFCYVWLIYCNLKK